MIFVVDEETYREAWEEYLDEVSRQVFLHQSEEFYQSLLSTNIENTEVLSDIPEDLRDDLAEMGAKVYTEQIDRVMNSKYVGDEYDLAAATAFLQPKKQVKAGAQAQGMIDANWEDIETGYLKEDYKSWISEVVINPWPPSHFELEHADRFKPAQDDRTFQ